MASIKKRGKSYSVIYTYKGEDGKTRQKWETYKNLADAKTRVKEIEYKKKINDLVVPQCTTVRELLEEYVECYGKEKWALSTYSSNISLINNYILPHIGDMKLADINPHFVERFYKKLQEIPAAGTTARGKKDKEVFVASSAIRDIHKILKSSFRQAIKWGLMGKNAAALADVPKYEAEERRIWTADTLFHALEVCDSEILKIAINLSFACSLRLGEILGLTWDCVDISEEAVKNRGASIYVNKELQRVKKKALKDLDRKDVLFLFPESKQNNKTVRVLKKPKTKSSIRRVFIPDSVVDMLKGWKEEQDKTKKILGDEYDDYGLVLTTAFGGPQSGAKIRSELDRLIRENDLPKIVFHSLRHTSITYKLKLNSGDIKAVQGDSGHSQAKMVTETYSHIIDEDRQLTAEMVEEAFYKKKELNPKMIQKTEGRNKVLEVPEGIDAELLTKVLNNPEMAALLSALASSMQKE